MESLRATGHLDVDTEVGRRGGGEEEAADHAGTCFCHARFFFMSTIVARSGPYKSSPAAFESSKNHPRTTRMSRAENGGNASGLTAGLDDAAG